MRKIVLDALKEKIHLSISEFLPNFELYKKSMQGDEKGLIRYRWRPNDSLWCFLVFRPLSSEGVEISIGWSMKDRCPYSIVSFSEASILNFDADEVMIPIILLSNRNGLSHWAFWQPTEEMLDNPSLYGIAYAEHFSKELDESGAFLLVSNAVDNGMKEVLTYGLPYLDKKIQYVASQGN